jgi:structural maintenance of chromosome 3 (chondroitin sulfate proteoglycan 6)
LLGISPHPFFLFTKKKNRYRLDDAQARLTALSLKQGRVARYTSKAERDKYLKKEISNIEAYEVSQQQTIESAQSELVSANSRLQEYEIRSEEVVQNLEQRKERMKEMAEKAASLKEEQTRLTEQRK